MEARTITEVRVFTRIELEKIAKWFAKAEIIGNIYRGDLGEQSAQWKLDGSCVVYTTHTPEG